MTSSEDVDYFGGPQFHSPHSGLLALRGWILCLPLLISGSFQESFLNNPEKSLISSTYSFVRASWWHSGKEFAYQCRRHRRYGFSLWVGKIPWRRKCNPLQYPCLENPMDSGTWWAIVHGVAKSGTRLSTSSHLSQTHPPFCPSFFFKAVFSISRTYSIYVLVYIFPKRKLYAWTVWVRCWPRESVNASSCVRGTVRPNKLKRSSLGQRKVYCRAMQGERRLVPLKALSSLQGFYRALLRAQWGRPVEGLWSAYAQVSDWLMVREQGVPAPGGLSLCAYGNQVVSFFQLLAGRVYICKTTQEMCLRYYYLGTPERS